MAIIWAEGFDHYGTGDTGRSNMLRGPWAYMAGQLYVSPQTTQKRTGSGSLKFAPNPATGQGARRVLGTARFVVGIAFGIYCTTLPPHYRDWETDRKSVV